MSKLYIANCTKQQQKVMYRVPEDPRPYPLFQYVRPGGQIEIAVKDLSPAAIEAIVGAHRPYGLIEVGEIDRTRPFFGMCYSVGKPISLDKIQRGLRHNDEVLDERGREIRKAGAIALSNAIEQQTGQNLAGLELSVEEENPDEHRGDGDPVAETIRVSRDVNPDGTSSSGRGRRRRAA